MSQDEYPNSKQKTVLRAPARQVEMHSYFKKIKHYHSLGEDKHYFYVRITLIITDIISLGLGIYILSRFDHFLGKEFDFKSRNLLLFFIYLYSPSAIGIFFVSFILAFFIYLFYCCFENEKIHGSPLFDENDTSLSFGGLNQDYEEGKQKANQEEDEDEEKHGGIDGMIDDENSYKKKNNNKMEEVKIRGEYIGINADKVTLLPYTMTIFVILTIVFYFVALPLSIILLKKLWKHQVYKEKKHFWALYTFIFDNLVNGVLIVVVFFHMFIVKRIENNILKSNMELDEEQLKSIRSEVREALKRAK